MFDHRLSNQLIVFVCILTASMSSRLLAQGGSVDDVAVLDLVGEYQDRKLQLEIESRRQLRSARSNTLRELRALQDKLLRDRQVDAAKEVSEIVSNFMRDNYAVETQLIQPNPNPTPPFVHNRPPMPTPFGPVPTPAAANKQENEKARAILNKFEDLRRDANTQFQNKLKAVADEIKPRLKAIQTRFTEDAKLDSAIMAGEAISFVVRGGVNALPDPGNVRASAQEIGKTYCYEVVGNTNGTPYGTDVYTTDSPLAASAVHAGLLKVGQKGIVKVTIVAGLNRFDGTFRNGVRSQDWGAYPVGFKVELVDGM